jgi:hypothetical protein
MRDHSISQLDNLIQAFLEDRMPFEAFESAYASQFLEGAPDSAFSPEDLEYYGSIHERCEWTTENPPSEDRLHGWMDIRQFTSWLREHRR